MANKKTPKKKPAVAKAQRKAGKPERQAKPEVQPVKIPERPASSASSPHHPALETFPVAAVGASAGGLEAFRKLLGALPQDTLLPFVIIQHLSPDHESNLPEILAKFTRIPVVEVEDGMRLEEGKIFVMPPNATMTLEGGRLRLAIRDGAVRNMPVDLFFRSLAAAQPHQAIAIILSGAGSDGALGLQEVKDAGGITFVQDEKSAKFDGMPRSAIATGAADFIMTPEEIAAELSGLYANLKTRAETQDPVQPTADEESVNTVFKLLRRANGVDFSQYKQTTVMRRIMRRMLLLRMDSVAGYAEFLRRNPAEIQALYQDILIKVTSFFRDPESFEALKKTIIPDILEKRVGDSSVRIWVPGCSTGEEAYSIAIVLLECLGDMSANTDIQIFATDISEEALAKARAGIYIENIAMDISPERLRRFFVRINSHYQISKHIRDMCVFARHDVGADHPFSRIDLISCRNLLIYLDINLQKRVFPTFHYALKPTGYLMLGTSETVGGFSDLYALADKKNKIYSKKMSLARYPAPPRAMSPYPIDHLEQPKSAREAAWSGTEIQKEADRVALAAYVPPGVVINGDMDIIQFRGQTGPYLEPAPGQASLNLLKMIRSPLLLDLRRTLDKCKRQKQAVKTKGLQMEAGGEFRNLDIEAIPLLTSTGSSETYYLVMFLDAPTAAEAQTAKVRKPIRAHEESQTRALRKELKAAKDYLQSVIEEHEATNEELKSANEEILSSNEELQSINEELETAKEELQSTNEELTTLNEELQNRNFELNQLNNDMTNLLSSVHVPIVMLGSDMRIRRFTPIAEKVLNLIPTDVGRPFTEIKSSIAPSSLDGMIHDVIDTMSVKEVEVRNSAGQWYSLRVRPYRTADNKIDGAVLVFIDIDTLKTNQRQLKDARAYSEGIVETVRTPLAVIDKEGQVVTANHAYLDTFPGGRTQVQGRSILELGFGGRPIPGLADLILGAKWWESVRDHEVELPNPSGLKTLVLNAGRLPGDEQKPQLTLLAMEDITDRKRAEEGLKSMVAELESFSYTVSHDLRAPLRAMQGVAEALGEDYGDKMDLTGQDYTRRIISAAHRMDALIQDLLSYSHMGQPERNLQSCSLDDAVNEAMVQLEKEIKDNHAELIVEKPLGRVMGHRTLLATVFLNLIGNAVKFTAPGLAPKVRIHARKTDGLVRVWVEDNGIGIDPGHLKRIFQVFERLHGVEKYPGTGIGLAIVRKGVENMEGKVGVESQPGQGSRFWIELPTGEEKP